MARNQFYYIRKESSPIQIEGGEEQFKEYTDSLNLEMVIRSMELGNGNLLILLNDIHQRPQQVEVKNRQGKVTAIKREMNTFQTEIILTEPEDIRSFRKLTNYNQ